MPYKDPDQQREYMCRWIKDRRRQWLAANGPCADCGTWGDLQVDHVDASLKVSHRVWSWSESRRQAELAKCVARCVPCHKKKTAGECLFGEQNPAAKLNAKAVREIRTMPGTGRAAAVKYGISPSQVSRIRRGVSWRRAA